MFQDMNNQIIVEYVEIDEFITLSDAVSQIATSPSPKETTQENEKS